MRKLLRQLLGLKYKNEYFIHKKQIAFLPFEMWKSQAFLMYFSA